MDYTDQQDDQQAGGYTPPWLIPGYVPGRAPPPAPVNTAAGSGSFHEFPNDFPGGAAATVDPSAPPIPSGVTSDFPGAAGAQLQPGGGPTTPWLDSVNPGGQPPGGEGASTAAPPIAGTTPPPPGNAGINDYGFNTGGSASDHAAAAPYQPLITAINTADGADARAAAMDALAQKVQADLVADGHKVSWDKNGHLIVDGRSYELGGTQPTDAGATLAGELAALRGLPKPPGVEPGGGGTPAGTSSGSTGLPDIPIPDWLANVPDYHPTPISTDLSDIPNFEELFGRATAGNPTDAKLEALVTNLLEHPESLSDDDVARLKAKSAEDAAVASQANDEELQHFGFNAGLDTSPWLAGQRVSNAQSRRNTTIQANQNIDIAAADRRQADRMAVAGLGESYGQYRTSRTQAGLNLALDGAFRKYGEQRSRVALNTQMEQFAAQHGLSKAQLIASYVTSRTGQEVDWQRLQQMGDQFQQDLAFKISQLSQQSDQFDAEMQMALQKFQHEKDNDAWTQAMQTYGK